jgi:sugar phosphate isomerase/epimerase
MKLAFEFHGNTVNDTANSSRRLLSEIAHPAVKSYWQPLPGFTHSDCLQSLRAVLPYLAGVHVFHWVGPGIERRPLEDGVELWVEYFDLISETGRDHYALLEFVRDDDPASFCEDADTLKNLLRRVNGSG